MILPRDLRTDECEGKPVSVTAYATARMFSDLIAARRPLLSVNLQVSLVASCSVDHRKCEFNGRAKSDLVDRVNNPVARMLLAGIGR